MDCLVVSLSRSDRYTDVESVTVPSQNGEMELLPGHAEAFVALQAGTVTVRARGKTSDIPVIAGICSVKNDAVRIILTAGASLSSSHGQTT